MRATVNSIDFYSSLSTTVLDTENRRGSVTVQATDEFDYTQNSEAVEIELTAFEKGVEVSFYSTLSYDNALFLANSIIKILEIQKTKL